MKENTMKVLMIGATGAYAGMVLPELKQRGVFVRALAQDDAAAAKARQKGANAGGFDRSAKPAGGGTGHGRRVSHQSGV